MCDCNAPSERSTQLLAGIIEDRPSVIIPNIYIKKETYEDEEQKAYLETIKHNYKSDGSMTCFQNMEVKMQVQDASSIGSSTAGPVPFQSFDYNDDHQNFTAMTNKQEFKDGVAASSDRAAKESSGCRDRDLINDSRSTKPTFPRPFRRGVPKSKELLSLLTKPFELNWRREVVYRAPGSSSTADAYYFTPTGRKLRSLPQVAAYLEQTKEKMLSINSFTFHRGRISDSSHESERYARNLKKNQQSSEKNVQEELVNKEAYQNPSISTWQRTGKGVMNGFQNCHGRNPAINNTHILSGHEIHDHQSGSHAARSTYGNSSSGNLISAHYQVRKNLGRGISPQHKVDANHCHQQKDHMGEARFYPPGNSECYHMSQQYQEHSTPGGYSSDYNVRCDAPHCQEPCGLPIWVECGFCGRWMHNVCIDLQPDQTYPDKLVYKCNCCQLRESNVFFGSGKAS